MKSSKAVVLRDTDDMALLRDAARRSLARHSANRQGGGVRRGSGRAPALLAGSGRAGVDLIGLAAGEEELSLAVVLMDELAGPPARSVRRRAAASRHPFGGRGGRQIISPSGHRQRQHHPNLDLRACGRGRRRCRVSRRGQRPRQRQEPDAARPRRLRRERVARQPLRRPDRTSRRGRDRAGGRFGPHRHADTGSFPARAVERPLRRRPAGGRASGRCRKSDAIPSLARLR